MFISKNLIILQIQLCFSFNVNFFKLSIIYISIKCDEEHYIQMYIILNLKKLTLKEKQS